jgi:acyl carrier protein
VVEIRTLAQVVEVLEGLMAGAATVTPAVAPAVTEVKTEAAIAPAPIAPTAPAAPAPVAIAPAAASEELSQTLVSIVSDKTGYPVEMLELDMDMEADLGIDSIKRVEILGTLMEAFPDLAKPDPEAVVEIRTLAQVVEVLQSLMTGAAPEAPAITVTAQAVAPSVPEVVSATVPEIAAPAATQSTALANAELSQTLVSIVSDKTGYPVEMLELDMDMEADLGIDSIKRVEILGTLMEAFPNMAKPDPEAVVEIRTLQEVVDVIATLLDGAEQKKKGDVVAVLEPAVAAVVTAEEQEDLEGIQRFLVKLKPLPAPDFLEFSFPAGAVALVTDDGSTVTATLVQELLQRGVQPVVLSFPLSLVPGRAALPASVQRLELQDMSEAHLAQQLSSIAQIGPIAAFFHLHPALPNHQTLYLETERQIVKQVFFMAKHLKPTLAQPGGRFYTVARMDGAFGFENHDYGAIAAGLFGLTKTLNMEWNATTCRALDLSPAFSPEQATQCILAELYDPDRRLVEVAYGSQGRTTLIA